MSLDKAIEAAFQLKEEKKWEYIYFAIDLHGTIIVPGRLIKLQVYPQAEEGLKYLSKVPFVKLILFTSTQVSELKEFYEWCKTNDIRFDYLNENPDVNQNDHSGDYTKKFYYNIMLDDRAGFYYKTDWYIVIDTFERYKSKLRLGV